MVILGGLELVAAGVILHKYNKGKELEKEQERKARERRHERRHHHRGESPRHTRKDNSLYPPEGHQHRAHSAPPPGYAPTWQAQPTYYPPQAWQPQQHEKNPAWNPQPSAYPPNWQPQPQPQPQPQTYPYPPAQPYAHPHPSQPQPQPSMYPIPHHDDTALSEILQRGPPNVGSQSGAQPQLRPSTVPPPDPNYTELSADTPRAHDMKPSASPHVMFDVPDDEGRRNLHDEPPPAYEEPRRS